MCAPKLSFPLALISFQKWGWGLLGWDISSVIHWHGYLTGSSLSLSSLTQDYKWDQLGNTAAGTLHWAPPAGAWLCWELLVGVGSSTVDWEHSFALSQEVGEVWRQFQFSTQLFIHLEPNLLPWYFLLWGGIILSCPVLWSPRLGP